MGNDDIILWLSPELARGYFLAVIVAMTGLIQVVAVRWARPELRWLPRRWATPLGLALAVGALAAFYATQYPLIWVPGPAGLELILMFAVGSALAVWLARALAALRDLRRASAPLAEG